MVIKDKALRRLHEGMCDAPLHDVAELIAKKTLAFMTLWMISKRGLSGYEIMKVFRKEGMAVATASRMYPLLAQLEKAKLINGKEQMNGRRKTKVYSITPNGKMILHGAAQWLRTGIRGQFFREMLAMGRK